jgi:hypothetical protein
MILDAHGKPIPNDALTEEQTVHRMIVELEACDEPLILGPLAPLEALQLAGLVQLAVRHPEVSEAHRAIAAAVVETVREYFGGSPAILDILERGDDPTQDVPR